jgi:hypothetical protein
MTIWTIFPLPLAHQDRLVLALTECESRAMVPAVSDAQHHGVPPVYRNQYHNSTCVDDNGVMDYRDRILGAIDNS